MVWKVYFGQSTESMISYALNVPHLCSVQEETHSLIKPNIMFTTVKSPQTKKLATVKVGQIQILGLMLIMFTILTSITIFESPILAMFSVILQTVTFFAFLKKLARVI